MEISTIMEITTVVITLVLGYVAKRNPKFNNKRIPVQNLLIGLASFVINFIITRDINGSLVFSGLLAGGTYDLLKNTYLILNNEVPKQLDEEILESEDLRNE